MCVCVCVCVCTHLEHVSTETGEISPRKSCVIKGGDAGRNERENLKRCRLNCRERERSVGTEGDIKHTRPREADKTHKLQNMAVRPPA